MLFNPMLVAAPPRGASIVKLRKKTKLEVGGVPK
jgi:hypothetical protein